MSGVLGPDSDLVVLPGVFGPTLQDRPSQSLHCQEFWGQPGNRYSPRLIAPNEEATKVDYCPFDIVARPESLDLETVYVETSYGGVAVRMSGSRQSDTATLYIHGVGADWTTWSPLIQTERIRSPSNTHDQLFINMPGFGDSENRLNQLRIADVGETFIRIVESLGYERLRIVGHSMGGFLTLDMASRFPERISSIHLVAGPYFSILKSIQHPLRSFRHDAMVASTFGLQYLLAHAGSLEVVTIRALYRAGLMRPLLAPFAARPFSLKASVVRALCTQVNPKGLLQTAANGAGYDADKQWSEIECPIWAVFGKGDRLVPQRDMARLLRCQPQANCRTVDDVGHLMHIERPSDVLDGLNLWL